ncbi:MAG: hypothetical protein WKG06_04220 [Segetibacter sp.]
MGKDSRGEGFIVSGKDTVTFFKTEQFGMGTFSFDPVKGKTYHAIIKLNNTTIKKDLPEIYNNGWTLHVADDGNKLSLKIACNIEAEHTVFLFVQTRGSVKSAAMLSLTNGNAAFAINKSDLGEGISQITVFNEKNNLCVKGCILKSLRTFYKLSLPVLKKNIRQEVK